MTEDQLEQAAQRAFAAYTGSGVDWAQQDDDVRALWRGVASAAGATGGTVIRMQFDPDLTITSFDDARSRLGGVPVVACAVIASTLNAAKLREIKELGASVIELPPAVMASPWAWIVTTAADGTAYSVPSA